MRTVGSMHKTTRTAALLLVAAAVALSGAACGRGKGTNSAAGAGASEHADANLGGAPTATPTDQPGSGSGGDSGSGGQNNTRNTNASASARPSASGPVIVYFRIKQRPECPKGTNVAPIPAVDLVVEWQVTGADQVTLSVDGPGVYKSYGPQGTETFYWSCGGKPGTTVSHTYLLRAVTPSGAEAKKTLTASAKVNEIPNV